MRFGSRLLTHASQFVSRWAANPNQQAKCIRSHLRLRRRGRQKTRDWLAMRSCSGPSASLDYRRHPRSKSTVLIVSPRRALALRSICTFTGATRLRIGPLRNVCPVAISTAAPSSLASLIPACQGRHFSQHEDHDQLAGTESLVSVGHDDGVTVPEIH